MTLDLRPAAALLTVSVAALLAACPAPEEEQKADPPVIALSAAAHAFPATECGALAPAPASIQVTNGGGGTLARPAAAVTWSDAPAGWLTVDVGGAEEPFTIGLTAWTSALPAGIHTALVELTSPGAAPKTITVTWEITPITTVEPVIGASPLVLSFSGQVGAAPPPSETVTVTNVGAGTLAPITATPGAAWVTAVVDGTTITVTASAEGLTSGRRGTTVNIGSAGAANDGQTVQVWFDVMPRIDTSSAGAFAAGFQTRIQERLVACSVRSAWEAEARADGISAYAADMAAANAAGRIGYVLAQANDCATAVEAASCQEVAEMEAWGALPAACEAALPPGVSVGGTCYGDADCLSGWCGGTSCPGTCSATKADGAVCAYDFECSSGFCDPTAYPRLCAADPGPGAEGEACAFTWPPCQSGLECDGYPGTCVALGAEGAACGEYGDPTRSPGCLAGLACADEMACRAVADAGDACSAIAPCISGAYCGAGGVCLEYPHEAGVACADPDGTGTFECSPYVAGWGEVGDLHCNQDTLICFYGTAVYRETCDRASNEPALQCAPGFRCGDVGNESLCDYDGWDGACY